MRDIDRIAHAADAQKPKENQQICARWEFIKRTSLFVDRRGAKGRYFRVVPGERRFEIAEGVIFSGLKREKFQSVSVLQRFGQRTSESRATFEWQKQR